MIIYFFFFFFFFSSRRRHTRCYRDWSSDVCSSDLWARQRHRLHRAVYFESQYLHPDYHRQICRTIRALATKEHVAIIYVDGPEMSQYVESDQTLPAFIDVHDSLTLLCTRMMKAETQWRKKCALYLQARDVSRWERCLGKRFPLVITNAPVDESMIKRLSPSAKTLAIANGVDTEFFTSNGEYVQSNKFVFTGVLGYGPNQDAVNLFLRVDISLHSRALSRSGVLGRRK